MRKESRLAAEAFLQYGEYIHNEYRGQPPKFTGKRTVVSHGEMNLHGNLIAWHHDRNTIVLCLRGWKTNVTLERLNGILELAHGQRPLFLRGGKVYYGTLVREVEANEFLTLPRYLPQEVTDGAAA